MNKTSDARIPVVFGGQPAPEDACLVEDGLALPATGYAFGFALPLAKLGHIVGCACCTPRGPVAEMLGRLFTSRARGQAPYFRQLVVLASPDGEAAVRTAVVEDVVVRARYTLAD
jgi:hypothetical protein